jgi:hypothetical protein
MFPGSVEIRTLLAAIRASLSGKFGRARENLRGKVTRAAGDGDDADEPPPHVPGN